jgi:imidazolonepropionase-like amidohydrolase
MRIATLIIAALLAARVALGAGTLAVTNVTVIDVEDGRSRPAQTVIIDGERILDVDHRSRVTVPPGATVVDGEGKFLLPGFWDMHVHSHRERRWTYHYPLFVAYGVTGVRDAGTHLASALQLMPAHASTAVAPTVIWGSPPLDGPDPVLSFALAIEDEAAADGIVSFLERSGFDFVKSYDRLTPAAYHALAHAAERQGLRIEGHVPLAMSPSDVAAAGHDLIDHLTLVVESCAPGALEHVHAMVAADPAAADSMEILMDSALERLLQGHDAGLCRTLFARFAELGVWQVPTLVQLRGFVLPEEARHATASRTLETTPALVAEWTAAAASGDRARLAAGASVYRRQLALLRPMQDAGVRLMIGTDASSEPWVFAGSSVHDEMALFVEAGLSPLEALQAATLRPLQYAGRARAGRAISAGETADLLLLDADPRIDIASTRSIRAVVMRGRLFDRDALGALLDQARAAASAVGEQHVNSVR